MLMMMMSTRERVNNKLIASKTGLVDFCVEGNIREEKAR